MFQWQIPKQPSTKLLRQGKFDQALVGHILTVGLHFDAGQQRDRHPQGDGLGREFQVRHRNPLGLGQVQVIGAGRLFAGRSFVFNRAHRFFFLFCSWDGLKSPATNFSG